MLIRCLKVVVNKTMGIENIKIVGMFGQMVHNIKGNGQTD